MIFYHESNPNFAYLLFQLSLDEHYFFGNLISNAGERIKLLQQLLVEFKWVSLAFHDCMFWHVCLCQLF